MEPASTNLAPPFLVRPTVPASPALMVVVALLTVIVGAVPASVSGPADPVLRNQLCFVALRSSKLRFPMVRALSSVTVASVVRCSVLKLAVLPEPFAIVPPLQLAAFAQPPPARLVHTPLTAPALRAPRREGRRMRDEG